MSQHDPSEPIEDCRKECTADERSALDARTPPYDGVRTWHDLEAVRALLEKKAPKAKPNDQ
mgnify:CR=1 FL=1